MDISAHIAAVIAYIPFIAAVPAGIAIICNRMDAARNHPNVVYSLCGLLSLCVALLWAKQSGTVDCVVAGVLAASCFALGYLRAIDALTKTAAALLSREPLSWGYGLMASLCAASAVLLWRSSPRAKYPLYAATLYLAGGALVGGIYNYVRDPTLLQGPIKLQIIAWLMPGIPSALLINCGLYARRITRGGGGLVAGGVP